MRTFTEEVNQYYPKRAIRVIVGATQTYIGVNCDGLNEMKPEQIEWLNAHKPIHVWFSAKEVEFVFRGSQKYEKIVWG